MSSDSVRRSGSFAGQRATPSSSSTRSLCCQGFPISRSGYAVRYRSICLSSTQPQKSGSSPGEGDSRAQSVPQPSV